MRRRPVLGVVLSGMLVGSGCVSGFGRRELAQVEDPPDWVQAHAECPDSHVKASLELSERIESVDDFTAVVEYARLSEDSKLIVRVAAQHESANTCGDTGATRFGRLYDELEQYATDPDRAAPGNRPPTFAIRVGDGFYVINEFRVYDQDFA